MIKGLITPGAGYDPDAGCLDGTRTKIQDDIHQWANGCTSEASKPVFWVNGLAGCGKSTVAHSICQWLGEVGRLGGAFFFRKDHEDLQSPENAVSTLAAGLALACQPYETKLTEILLKHPQISNSKLALRFKGMLMDPLQELDKKLLQSPIVAVLDGLDECGTSDTRFRFVKYLLELSRIMPWFKIIITCRGLEEFSDYLKKAENDTDVLLYDLFEGDPATTNNDIRLYIQNHLVQLAEDEAMVQVSGLDKMNIEELTIRASGLFIYAQVACRFICSSPHPKQTVESLVSGEPMEDPIEQLHSLYSSIIASVLDEDIEKLHIFRSCIVAVTIARTPLTDTALADLLADQAALSGLRSMIRTLDPLLYRDYTGSVRIRHGSFSQYIVDAQCPTEYRIEPDDENLEYAILCLQTMVKELRFNICELEESTLYNHEISDLAARIRDNIPSHLQYSCLYWSSHLVSSPAFKPTLRRHYSVTVLLDRLLPGPRCLYWVEILSLLGKLPIGEKNLFELVDWIKNTEHRISTHAEDIRRFISAFKLPITQSTPHLYTTAVAFGAVRFDVIRRLAKDFPNTLQITSGKHLGRLSNASSKITQHPSLASIQSAAFSPGGNMIATCEHGHIHIWDARTGSAVLNPLAVPYGDTPAVGFSPDGRRIVASTRSKQPILVWDLQKDAVTQPQMQLPWPSGIVTSVEFSPDGMSIASGSQDCTVAVWDPNNGRMILGPMKGHTDSVTCVAFSSGGRYVVSGSLDKTVRVWDLRNGVAAIDPLQGHTDGVTCVAISPDENYIASGSQDKSVRLWNAHTGTPLLNPPQAHSGRVRCVAFSSSAKYVASGCSGGMLQVWDLHNGTCAFDLHHRRFERIISLTFPSNEHYIVYGTSHEVYLWDLRAGCSRSVQGHSDNVHCVAFSPNSQKIVTGSRDKTAKVWDLRSEPVKLLTVEEHPSVVNYVSFSSDGNRVFASSYEGTAAARSPDGRCIALASQTIVTYAASRNHDECEWIPLKSWNQRKLGPPPTGSRDTRQKARYCPRVWDLASKTKLFDPDTGHSEPITCLVFSPDGQRVVTGSWDNTIWVWDINTGATPGLLEGHSKGVTCVAISTDCQRIISGSYDTTLRVWDLHTGTLARDPLEGHSGSVDCVAFSPNGQYAVSGAFEEIWVWDLFSGAIFYSLKGQNHTAKSVSFSPNGDFVASSDDYENKVQIWDISNMSLLTYPLRSDFPHSLPVSRIFSYQLAKLLGKENWVLDSNNKPILWLPREYQRSESDNSFLAISYDLREHPVSFDFSKFKHGISWASIRGITASGNSNNKYEE